MAFAAALCPLIIQGCASVTGAPAASPLAGLFAEITAWEEARNPLGRLSEGALPAALPDASVARLAAGAAAREAFLERLQALDARTLSATERTSRRIMAFKLRDGIDRQRHGARLVPFNAEGGFYLANSLAAGRLALTSASERADYLRWLTRYAAWIDSHEALLAAGIRAGKLPPRLVIDNNLALLVPFTDADVDRHPDLVVLGALDADERKAASAVLESDLRPAYRRLRALLAGAYREAAPEAVGVSVIPGGAEFYANRIAFFSTLPLTADQLFDLGEREVARIGAAMEEIVAEVGFDGDVRAFIAHLRTAPEFYPRTAQALLERAAWLTKTIEGELPRYFDPLYRLPLTVEPVPALIAPSYTSGRYVSGSLEARRPGIYWVNTTRLESRALFNLPALSLHEGVPGHHLQHARAAELADLPAFRREYYISAFGEGWGLYAEYLGEEMGLYASPYERFGRLSYEMWRACRLVVDVGIHARGWSRARAIDYLGARTALSKLEVANEIDRYIGWPGQALAYKVGELVIRGLRLEAERELDRDFDVRQFHEAILSAGSVTLDVLIDRVRTQLELSGNGIPIPGLIADAG
ncbi:MAG: DUF885 domain-containing protein [Pseudomonadota bacterium]